jgi:hypothetical protein
MHKKFMFVPVLLALSACATAIDTAHIARMNGFIGRSEREVIDAWGVPDKSYQTDTGEKFLTYVRGTQQLVGEGLSLSTCTGNGVGSLGYGGCFGGFPPARTVTYYCDFTFDIARGRVKEWFQQGNDCPRIR